MKISWKSTVLTVFKIFRGIKTETTSQEIADLWVKKLDKKNYLVPEYFHGSNLRNFPETRKRFEAGFALF